MIVHTPTIFRFPPTNPPTEIGHPWPTYSVPLTPAHMNLLCSLTYQTQRVPYVLVHAACFIRIFTVEVATNHFDWLLTNFHALQASNHLFVLWCWRHCFWIFICLFVSYNTLQVQLQLLLIYLKLLPKHPHHSASVAQRLVLAQCLYPGSVKPAHSEGQPARLG